MSVLLWECCGEAVTDIIKHSSCHLEIINEVRVSEATNITVPPLSVVQTLPWKASAKNLAPFLLMFFFQFFYSTDADFSCRETLLVQHKPRRDGSIFTPVYSACLHAHVTLGALLCRRVTSGSHSVQTHNWWKSQLMCHMNERTKKKNQNSAVWM